MSEIQTQIETVFDLQRTAVEGSQQAFQQSLQAQSRAAELFVEGLRTNASAADSGVDVTQAAVDAYFDALATSVPGDAEGVEELRASVHEGVEAGADVQAETWRAIEELAEENVAAYEEFAADYADVVEDSFDAFLAAHEQVEGQTVSTAEAVEQQVEVASEQ